MPAVSQYENYRQLSKFSRGRIVGLCEGDLSYREVANCFDRNQS